MLSLHIFMQTAEMLPQKEWKLLLQINITEKTESASTIYKNAVFYFRGNHGRIGGKHFSKINLKNYYKIAIETGLPHVQGIDKDFGRVYRYMCSIEVERVQLCDSVIFYSLSIFLNFSLHSLWYI